MPKTKLPESIKKAAKEFLKLEETKRLATNEANREKTVLKNEIKSHWLKEKLPIGSYLRVAGKEFRYSGAIKKTYDVEAVLDLYEEKEITREQFLRMMKLDSTQLANVLGADQAADLTTEEIGSAIDIRISDLSSEDDGDEFIMVERRVRTKKRRSVFGQREDAKKQPIERSPKRKIKVRKN